MKHIFSIKKFNEIINSKDDLSNIVQNTLENIPMDNIINSIDNIK